jgi:HEAT repeat protein
VTSPATAETNLPGRLASAGDYSDAALIAAIPDGNGTTCRALTEEAARRRLAAAVPALEALCRRFKGFGVHHAVAEQKAALQALADIGGRDAAQAVGRMITDNVVQEPGLAAALDAACRLGCRLPAVVAATLLRHADPAIRANAARCAPSNAAVVAILIDLLGDLHSNVANAAAHALGRMGQTEARPLLIRLLQTQPSAETIDALACIPDPTSIVLLGRIARSTQALAAAALNALREIEDERAAAIVARAASGS